ncbi:MAG: mechanosensitive ion channel family protein, partial [Steroidobacteraceae bacterium]
MPGVSLPEHWPELTLALTLVLLVSYLVAGFASRLAGMILRAIVTDPDTHPLFVIRPQRIIRWMTFLVTTAALTLPALKLAGYKSRLGSDPEALARWLLTTGPRIALICVAAYFMNRMGSAAASRFERDMSRGTGLNVIERTKRAQTLSRLLQRGLSVAIVGIAILMVLRELDIDIAPLLTGAGIAGIAFGFGAQNLLRDIIAGFFLILEDQIRVGDAAVVNGQGGSVEQVNLRTLVLRDEEGAVHVFPNGGIQTLANRSKDFSFYVITVAIPTEEDPDRVMQAMRDAAATLLEDPELRPVILEPLEIYGIDTWEPGQVTIRARIKTVPLKQWSV